jgi:hypothetical protein
MHYLLFINTISQTFIKNQLVTRITSWTHDYTNLRKII